MSAQSVPFALPDPFLQTPSYIAAPISGISHISATQQLNSGTFTTNNQLYSSQCVCPFIVNYAGTSTGTFLLPDAFSLSQAYGNSYIPVSIAQQIPNFSILPSNQVQPGDVFAIPLNVLSTSTQSVTFLPGSGGTGSHVTPAYSSIGNRDQLVIQFTSVGASLPYTTYTLQ